MSKELIEPVAYMFQHEETGRTMCVESQQVEWNFEKNNPRLFRCGALYSQSAIDALQADNARLREFCEFAWRDIPICVRQQ